jgi:hypothetical protein
MQIKKSGKSPIRLSRVVLGVGVLSVAILASGAGIAAAAPANVHAWSATHASTSHDSKDTGNERSSRDRSTDSKDGVKDGSSDNSGDQPSPDVSPPNDG